MQSYINVHKMVQNRREAACGGVGVGPRVILVGPTDAGKSTVCRLLVNWAVRSGHEPTLVDLDVGKWRCSAVRCARAAIWAAPGRRVGALLGAALLCWMRLRGALRSRPP
jgi:hypothetical protein